MHDREILEECVAMRIAKSTEAMQQSFELTPLLVQASATFANTLLNDGKILVLGTGPSAALAQIFSAQLMNKFERDRPGLPAIALSADSVMISSLVDQPTSGQFARQIKALGKEGDCLMVISVSGTRNNVIQAVIAAHEMKLAVVALTGGSGGEIGPLLNYRDIDLRVHSDYPSTVREQHLFLIHCLGELIDRQIFG